MPVTFDDERFFRAIQRARIDQGVSWRELGRRLSISPSTFSRMAQGRRPDVETFLALLHWLGMPADAFMLGTVNSATPGKEDALALIRAALVQDPEISPDDIEPIEDIVRVAYTRFRRLRR